MKSACALTLLLLTATASAQTPQSNEDEKSPAVATALAIGTTFAGYGMILGGGSMEGPATVPLVLGGQLVSAIGPSAGHFYAGETRHGLVFSGIRTAALVAADAGAIWAFSCIPGEAIGGDGSSECDARSGALVFFGGLGVAAAFGIYDWIDASRAARRHNRASASKVQAMFTPIMDHTRGTLGLGLSGAF